MIFIAGTKLMVAKAARVSDISGLKGKSIVVTRGTTNGPAIEAADRKLALGLKLVTAVDHEQSYQMLADGKVDAFATDDILLHGLIARHRAQDRFKVIGDLLSYEPYGIMYRRNEPKLAAGVERTFRKLATNHDLMPLYEKWFLRRLPTGERLGVPIPPQLEQSFAMMNASPGARQ
jgi:glutamate/aspartate transport system substrate-binding protein